MFYQGGYEGTKNTGAQSKGKTLALHGYKFNLVQWLEPDRSSIHSEYQEGSAGIRA